MLDEPVRRARLVADNCARSLPTSVVGGAAGDCARRAFGGNRYCRRQSKTLNARRAPDRLPNMLPQKAAHMNSQRNSTRNRISKSSRQAVLVTPSVLLSACGHDSSSPRAPQMLNVTGSGLGAISSSPAGINCALSASGSSGSCTASFAYGTSVSLMAVPSQGGTFAGDVGPEFDGSPEVE